MELIMDSLTLKKESGKTVTMYGFNGRKEYSIVYHNVLDDENKKPIWFGLKLFDLLFHGEARR
jgi:hypothetical protein